jgi:fermentation-respiration switch protein FrsA (DUF1100 family)
MVRRTDVEFPAEGEVTLRGWLFEPDGPGPHPGITMAHGYAGTKEHGIEPFALAFGEAGFAVLLHDHRSFGTSDGSPRQDVDPWQQIKDWRRAISFLEAHPAVDPDRIGLWGTSFAGGHAIVLSATDPRVKCVVSQVPIINGYEQMQRRVQPDSMAALEELLAADERAQARGETPRTQAVVSKDPTVPASYRAPDAVEFYLQPIPDGIWENSVTVRSTRAARMYEPGNWIARISPTPLLMVVATHDTVTPTDLALDAYERALQPKRLCLVPGGHFEPYLSQFTRASGEAVAWFRTHLLNSSP